MRYESKRKPRHCPRCKSKTVATILYGYPNFSEDLLRDLDNHKIVLGGCGILIDGPKWKCAECETEINGLGKEEGRGG